MNGIPVLGQPYIFQCVGEVFQKRILCLGGKWLYSQGSGADMLLRYCGLPLRLDVLHKLIQIVGFLPLMQSFQLLTVGKQDQLVLCAGGCNIDQLLIVLEPVIGALLGPVGKCRGKKYHVLFIPLKCMDCSTNDILQLPLLDLFLNEHSLIHKGCDDRHTFVFVMLRIIHDCRHLCR